MPGFSLIEDQLLGSAASSITFSTGLSGYTKFRLTLYVIKDATDGYVYLRLNGVTGTAYAYQDITADSATVNGARVTGAGQFVLDTDDTVDGSATAIFTVGVSKPLATTPARMTAQSSYVQTTGALINFEALSGEWANTSDLLSSLAVLASAGNFAIGTRAVLEGAA